MRDPTKSRKLASRREHRHERYAFRQLRLAQEFAGDNNNVISVPVPREYDKTNIQLFCAAPVIDLTADAA